MHGRLGWIAVGLLLAVPVMAQAQQSGARDQVPPAKQSATKKTAKPATKPAATSDAASRRLPSTGIDRTTAGPARSTERPIPREQPTALGRLSIPGGSLGYESETSMKAYDLSDGRRVPGYENIQRNDSSYFGLSVRMPTSGSLFRSHGAD
jgi:hypothetical protein